jgi:hypothetical protein
MLDGVLTRWPSLSRDGMRPAPLVAEEFLPSLAVRNSRHFKRLPPVDSQACYKNARGFMNSTKLLPRLKTHVRCGHPDCDWGTPMPGFSEGEVDRCRHEFREHCIERHGLDPNDTDGSAGSIWKR